MAHAAIGIWGVIDRDIFPILNVGVAIGARPRIFTRMGFISVAFSAGFQAQAFQFKRELSLKICVAVTARACAEVVVVVDLTPGVG